MTRQHRFMSRWRDGFLAFVLLFDPQKSCDGVLGNRDLKLRQCRRDFAAGRTLGVQFKKFVAQWRQDGGFSAKRTLIRFGEFAKLLFCFFDVYWIHNYLIFEFDTVFGKRGDGTAPPPLSSPRMQSIRS